MIPSVWRVVEIAGLRRGFGFKTSSCAGVRLRRGSDLLTGDQEVPRSQPDSRKGRSLAGKAREYASYTKDARA